MLYRAAGKSSLDPDSLYRTFDYRACGTMQAVSPLDKGCAELELALESCSAAGKR